MARHRFLLLLIGWLGGWLGSPSAQAALPPGFGEHPEDLRVKLVTFGPGPDAHQLFGHSALWVEDTRLRTDVLYSYGMTTHEGQGSPLHFLVRHQPFWAARLPVAHTFATYQREDRSITAQELRLPLRARQRLLARLERDVSPEHRLYAYHPTDNNCATRVRDALDDALEGSLRADASLPARFTWREHLRRHTRHSPVVSLLLLTWVNDVMDAPRTRWEEAFVPRELARLLDTSSAPRGRVDVYVSRARPVSDQEAGTSALPHLFLVGAVVGGGAVVLSILRERGATPGARIAFGLYHALFGLLSGAVGFVGLLLTRYSEHSALRCSEGLLLFNPFALALVPLGIGLAFGSARAERWTRTCVGVLMGCALLAGVLQLLPAFGQDLREPLALMLVAHLGLGMAWGGTSNAVPRMEARPQRA
ncbi:lipoprotein N-acyltransferase Lnb domain-containing protein [Corallococcus carmarthensis]|uniref:lipoprotein N-acyltransferase Lnb domain-containing protein n=1 Tax=Corallococcus carmarthensis TaxID=2316728 RepID=UPI00148CCA02|nr:DUF4105 domain-containing protein [Corallococcus carmarthensis]NOK16125.1 DUF4105 domain-containing protein [Corallococcus carmarthensis]